MKFLLILIMFGTMNAQNSMFDFSHNEAKKGWLIVNDGVMGGLSKGNLNSLKTMQNLAEMFPQIIMVVSPWL